MRFLLAAVALAFCLAGCVTVPELVGDVTTATGLTVTRHDALIVADSIATTETADTAAMNICTKAGTFTGVCSESVITKGHNAIVASRAARDNLLTYANEHNDLPAGPGGVYEIATDALSSLQAAITALGATPPPVPAPATGS